MIHRQNGGCLVMSDWHNRRISVIIELSKKEFEIMAVTYSEDSIIKKIGRKMKTGTYKNNLLKIAKIAVGAGISITAAQWLGLNYSSSAGVITLLSIHDTKKETIRATLRRMISFFVSLVLASVSFRLFGYHVSAIVVFLLFFSAFCIVFRTPEGLSVNTVLMTHFFAEQSMLPEQMVNEFLLLLVGAGVGVLFNLYIPGRKKQIIDSQRQIEGRIKQILVNMAGALSGMMKGCNQQSSLLQLEAELEMGVRSAYLDMENTLLTETSYYIRYMELRKSQAVILQRIENNICQLQTLPPQAKQIAQLIGHIKLHFHEHNNALELLKELAEVKETLRKQPLPEEREEFENRAVLFLILLELEQFLVMKRDFVLQLSNEEIAEFWMS